MEFASKRAIVTGGGRGIGRATVLRLAREGAQVVAIGRNLRDLESVRQESGCEIVQVDLRDAAATRAAASAIKTVDCLVNCAGIVTLQPLTQTTTEAFDEIMAVNVRAALILAQEVAKKLIEERRSGAIVNVSSTASFLGQPEHTAYAASKAALDALTRAMAVELGVYNIRANSVNPTVTMTAMATKAWSDPAKAGPLLKRIPLGRFVEPAEVADAILYLLSDRAAMINGVTLRVDGGHLIT